MQAIGNFAGAIFGRVNEETPDHVVLHEAEGYEIWRYPSSVTAVVYAADLPEDGSDKPFTSRAFWLLANYIGVLSTPQNVAAKKAGDNSSSEKVAMTAPVVLSPADEPEKVAMTAPVVMTPAEEPEKVAMTAPVVLTPEPEKVAMTAPVVMGNAGQSKGESMKFLLPSKYKTVEEAPTPTNPAVKIELDEAGRTDAVLSFSGNLDMKGNAPAKAKELMEMLERDGVKVSGGWTAHGYNAPFVLPWLKRNEIHIAVDAAQFEGRSS